MPLDHRGSASSAPRASASGGGRGVGSHMASSPASSVGSDYLIPREATEQQPTYMDFSDDTPAPGEYSRRVQPVYGYSGKFRGGAASTYWLGLSILLK